MIGTAFLAESTMTEVAMTGDPAMIDVAGLRKVYPGGTVAVDSIESTPPVSIISVKVWPSIVNGTSAVPDVSVDISTEATRTS